MGRIQFFYATIDDDVRLSYWKTQVGEFTRLLSRPPIPMHVCCIGNNTSLAPAARTSKKRRLSVTRMPLQLVRFNVCSLEQLSITEKRPAPTGFNAQQNL